MSKPQHFTQASEAQLPPLLQVVKPEVAASTHNAAPTGSTTLNHIRGPSASDELAEQKAERAELVLKLQKLSREIADAELVQLIAAVPE